MLPFGHFAGGYLAASATAAALSGAFLQAADPKFIWVAIAASVLVDLDDVVAFVKIGRLIARTKSVDHRKFFTHIPLVHFAVSLLVAAGGYWAGSVDWRLFAIFYFVGTFTHLFLDSFGYGVMWRWPFSSRLYAFSRAGKDFDIPTTLPVVEYWKTFVKEYLKTPVFYLEAAVIVFALIILQVHF